MIDFDNELAEDYLAECRERLPGIEADLLAIENGGAEIDEDVINRVLRALHAIKEGAGCLDLVKIHDLAHQTEDALALIRSHKMVLTPEGAGLLLRATDRLNELIQNPGASNHADIGEIMAALARLPADRRASAGKDAPSAVSQVQQCGRHLRVLLAEDDFASRLLLQTFLSRYGECHVAVNGREAVEAFRSALELGQRYDLICMDIMMPEMDGREAVRQVRAIEVTHGIPSTSGANIIMTTAVDDIKEVALCFRELCDAYLVKPIDLDKLLSQMKAYQLIQ